MKILIIGSSGFIGKFLSQKLTGQGYGVIGLDSKLPDEKENQFDFILGNISNPEDIIKAAKGVNAIIHLAAAHHDFGISKEEYFNVNVKGTKNILDCATQLGIKKFIFYSTVAVYENHKECVTEKIPTKPATPYGKSKLDAEKLIHNWAARDSTRESVIIRPVVVFGPHNYANTYKLIDSIYKKRFFFVGKGDNVKSVAYVENIVDATIFLLERMKPGINIYNYSDYPQMTINKTVKTISQYLSCRIPGFRIPLAPALVITSIFDLLGKLTGFNFPITAFRIKKFNTPTHFSSDKIRQDGFKQKIDLSEGFRRMVEWYLIHEVKDYRSIAYKGVLYEQKAS